MKTLTIRGIDRSLHQLLRKESEKTGVSVNRWVVHCIERALGIKKNPAKHHDLDKFFGSWSREESEAFRKATAVFEEVEPELWK